MEKPASGESMNILDQLKRDEGFRQFPYKDTVGILTVGYGRNLEATGINKEEAAFLLQRDVDRVTASLRSALPVFDSLSDARKGVLVNMAFNLGLLGLLRFRQMISCLNKGDYSGAAREMLDSDWAKQVGARADRLAKQMVEDSWV